MNCVRYGRSSWRIMKIFGTSVSKPVTNKYCAYKGFAFTYNRITKLSKLFKLPSHQSKRIVLGGILTFFGLRKKTEEEELEEQIISEIKWGILSMHKEQYEKAEDHLHSALKTAQENNRQDAITYCFDILANVAFLQKDFEKSEKLFLEVMKRTIATGTPQNDNSLVEISLKLSDIYSRRGDDTRATTGFLFCINTQQTKADELKTVKELSEEDLNTLALLAMSIDWFARHLMSREKFGEAEIQLRRAYELAERIHGRLHPQTIVMLNDLGSVLTMQGKFEESADLLGEAINRAKVSQESPDLATLYCNLGTTFLKMGNLELAYQNCNRALGLARSTQIDETEENALGCLEELKKNGFTKETV